MKKPDKAPRAARWILTAAATTAIISLMCLAVILGSYAVGGPAWPALYWIGLYGLPLAFALLALWLIMTLWSRRS